MSRPSGIRRLLLAATAAVVPTLVVAACAIQLRGDDDSALAAASAPDGSIVARLEPDGPTADGTTAAGNWFLDLNISSGGYSIASNYGHPPAARIVAAGSSDIRIYLADGSELPVREDGSGALVVGGRSGPVLTLHPPWDVPRFQTVTFGPELLREPMLSHVVLLGYWLPSRDLAGRA